MGAQFKAVPYSTSSHTVPQQSLSTLWDIHVLFAQKQSMKVKNAAHPSQILTCTQTHLFPIAVGLALRLPSGDGWLGACFAEGLQGGASPASAPRGLFLPATISRSILPRLLGRWLPPGAGESMGGCPGSPWGALLREGAGWGGGAAACGGAPPGAIVLAWLDSSQAAASKGELAVDPNCDILSGTSGELGARWCLLSAAAHRQPGGTPSSSGSSLRPCRIQKGLQALYKRQLFVVGER
eukprot:802129-Pelagomonas_calceolata.AAC.3